MKTDITHPVDSSPAQSKPRTRFDSNGGNYDLLLLAVTERHFYFWKGFSNLDLTRASDVSEPAQLRVSEKAQSMTHEASMTDGLLEDLI